MQDHFHSCADGPPESTDLYLAYLSSRCQLRGCSANAWQNVGKSTRDGHHLVALAHSLSPIVEHASRAGTARLRPYVRAGHSRT